MPNGAFQRTPETYRSDIDGLRAVAITSVVLYHAGVPFLTGGFTGVDVFFVISGYLIGGHIFAELRARKFSFLSFYRRRAKRILPAFYLVMSFTLVEAMLLLSPAEAGRYAKGAISAALSVSNIYFLKSAGYFQSANEMNPLLMTWSLGVEEQFYMIIPLVMVFLARTRRGLILPAMIVVCVLSFLFAWSKLGTHPDMVFYLLPARAWELGVGVMLAVTELLLERKISDSAWTNVFSVGGMVLILAPMYFYTSATPFPGLAALPSVLGSALVIAFPTGWINRRVLSLTPFTSIGQISYSWYLWHWPMLAFLRVASGGGLPPLAAAFAVLASLAAAATSFRYIEQPYRRSTREPVPLLLRYAGLTVVFVGVFGLIWKGHGLPERYPALAQEKEAQSDPCLADYGVDKPNLTSRCYASSDPRPSIVLWGDSHSAALAPALQQIVNRAGYNFIQLSKASCLPLHGVAKFVPQHPLVVEECMLFNDRVLPLIASDPRIKAVVLAGRWGEPFQTANNNPLVKDLASAREPYNSEMIQGRFTQSLFDTVSYLQKSGKRVVLVSDVPNYDFDPSLRFMTSRIPFRRDIAKLIGENPTHQTSGPDSYAAGNSLSIGFLYQARLRYPEVIVVDLKSQFCDPSDQCTYANKDQLFYSDGQHVTPEGARFALRAYHIPDL
ncbi:MAG TPA: acyltransferase family protein [Ktedonobacteraceae bacterium]|nr:acyltransferase family protein [Ktedonobacteraceae bacterium]